MKGSLVLDPCGAEQAQQEAGGTLALMPTANEVAPCSHMSISSIAQLLEPSWLIEGLCTMMAPDVLH